ncbi:cupin domain-containing protein [Curtobacterium sp. MCPF17_003]|uniref:cupin domain-containing protein n=1 Tax=Curtobacterium sp. MCPF17_003 TaxID=2175637 RepID=UPI002815DD80|nr:cupin domain-containing protein [Curtobacterium sp. MCPF17_003]
MSAGIVRFAPGARTAWHVHALGQTLHVTDGVAIIRNRSGETVVAHSGDTIHTPPGEWHWHGATSDRFMTHLALSEADPESTEPNVTWGEHVTDDEYTAAQN